MASKPPEGQRKISFIQWLRYTVETVALVVFTLLMTLLPWAIVWRFGRGFGWFMVRFVPIRKDVVKRNLKRAFPDWDLQQLETTIRDVYMHWGESFISTMKIWTLPDRKILKLVSSPGFADYTRAKQAANEPYILFTGHFGSWECAGRYMGIIVGKTSAIYRIQRNPLADKFLTWLRNRKNMVLVDSWSKMPTFLKTLNEVGNVCVVGDQYKGRQGVTVDFFNLPSPSPKGVAVLAHRSAAEIIFVAMHVHKGKYIMDWEPLQFNPPERIDDEYIHEVVGTGLNKLEAVIRKYPEQYLWFHKRWRNIDLMESAAQTTPPTSP